VVWGNGYAGTVDLLCEINGEPWIVDFKTGQNIWPSAEIQVSAYKEAITDIPNIKLGILQLGYWRTKTKYKFTEIKDKYDLFLAAKRIWQNDQEGVEPKQKDYPMELKLA